MPFLRLGFRAWSITPWSQVLNALVLGFLLFLIAFLYWIQRDLKPLMAHLKSEQWVTAFLGQETNETDEGRIKEEIEKIFNGNNRIKISFTGFEKMLESMTSSSNYVGQQLQKELESLGPDAHKVIPRYFTISGVIPKPKVAQLEKIKGVESLELTNDPFKQGLGPLSALRTIAKTIIGGLLVTLLLSLVHLAQVNTLVHRKTLHLIKFWGAGDFELRFPVIIGGFATGLAGGGLSFLFWTLLVSSRFFEHLQSFSPLLSNLHPPTPTFGLFVFIAGVAAGMVSGILVRLPNDL